MSTGQGGKRRIEIYRYDPVEGGDGHFDHFDLQIEDETNTTILDVLLRLQKEQDSSLAFRYACRVNMCGSCGMVINGREGLACKTNVSDFSKNLTITIRPLNHFPVVKDLVVDMGPFFKSFENTLPFFEPKEIKEEPEIIRPDSRERQAIGLATECIACGCCVSSCTMANYHEDYAGPAPLNRAFTLLMDSRDSLFDPRMEKVLESCYNCRTEFNCTEVCPKDISCTRAIKYIQRLAVKEPFKAVPATNTVVSTASVPQPAVDHIHEQERVSSGIITSPAVAKATEQEDMGRRKFLTKLTFGIGAASTLAVGGVLASAFIGPTDKKPSLWVPAGKLENFPVGKISTVNLRYEEKTAFYRQQIVKPILIWRQPNENKIVVYNTACTHLGCTVHWDETQHLFLCACHGGAFDIEGIVKAGPPPRPLDQLAFRMDSGNLLIEMA